MCFFHHLGKFWLKEHWTPRFFFLGEFTPCGNKKIGIFLFFNENSKQVCDKLETIKLNPKWQVEVIANSNYHNGIQKVNLNNHNIIQQVLNLDLWTCHDCTGHQTSKLWEPDVKHTMKLSVKWPCFDPALGHSFIPEPLFQPLSTVMCEIMKIS